jgi:cyclomaltodextrinase / maltogenic alpha-amylase / neopullulanase
MSFEPLPSDPRTGTYRHYKGGLYRVLHIARHSESLENFVVYQALYGDGNVWVRPLDMFMENVQIGGKEVPRFEFLHD